MDLFEAINKRRSIRKYLDTPVAREDLEKIVAAGVEAPSGCNLQLRQYIIVDDPAVMDQLRPASNAIGNAPAAIVVIIDPKASPYGEYWIQDASAAMENMLLAAEALGYGGCWIEGPLRSVPENEDRYREILGVPEKLRVWCLTPIGRPAEEATRPPKPSAADVTFYNRFGSK